MATYHILLGGNEGDVDATMAEALERLTAVGRVSRVSHVVESQAWGYASPLPYHNVAAELSTGMTPQSLLAALQRVERDLGRQVKTTAAAGYQDRPIDIDILLCGATVVDEPGLQIPHSRLHLRRFALAPLAEIAADAIHPKLRKSVGELLDECEDGGQVVRVGHLRHIVTPKARHESDLRMQNTQKENEI